MNTKDLIRFGVPVGEPIQLAHGFIQDFIAQGAGDEPAQAVWISVLHKISCLKVCDNL